MRELCSECKNELVVCSKENHVFYIILSGCGGTDDKTQQPTDNAGTTTEEPGNESTDAPETEGGIKDYEDLDLPEYISFSTYDVGTATFSQVAGLCEGILQKTGLVTRQIVASTDKARLIPTRAGTINFVVGTANMVQLAGTGDSPFNTTDWGPQQFRQITTLQDCKA